MNRPPGQHRLGNRSSVRNTRAAPRCEPTTMGVVTVPDTCCVNDWKPDSDTISGTGPSTGTRTVNRPSQSVKGHLGPGTYKLQSCVRQYFTRYRQDLTQPPLYWPLWRYVHAVAYARDVQHGVRVSRRLGGHANMVVSRHVKAH